MALFGRSRRPRFAAAMQRWLPLLSLCLLSTGSSVLLAPESVRAADELVLTYGPIEQVIDVRNLERFVETGEQSNEIRYLLRLSGQDPEAVRRLLRHELKLDFMLMHRLLNSLPGEYLLYEIGKVVHTKSRRANIQSLRAAVLLPLSQEGTLTPLSFFQNYPTQQLYLDGVELAQLVRRLSDLVSNVRTDLAMPLAIIQDFLNGLVCDCPPLEP